MRRITNYIIYTLTIIFTLTLCSCSRKDIIPQDKMRDILYDMYVSDQYVSLNPQHRVHKDTTLFYEAIIERYGYTGEMFTHSVEYYLSKKDKYHIINQRVKEKLENKRKEITSRIQNDNKHIEIISWLYDTIKTLKPHEYNRNLQLRSYRWLVMSQYPDKVRICDSIPEDAPYNKIWWMNNIRITNRDSSLIKTKDTLTVVQRDSITAAQPDTIKVAQNDTVTAAQIDTVTATQKETISAAPKDKVTDTLKDTVTNTQKSRVNDAQKDTTADLSQDAKMY